MKLARPATETAANLRPAIRRQAIVSRRLHSSSCRSECTPDTPPDLSNPTFLARRLEPRRVVLHPQHLCRAASGSETSQASCWGLERYSYVRCCTRQDFQNLWAAS